MCSMSRACACIYIYICMLHVCLVADADSKLRCLPPYAGVEGVELLLEPLVEGVGARRAQLEGGEHLQFRIEVILGALQPVEEAATYDLRRSRLVRLRP